MDAQTSFPFALDKLDDDGTDAWMNLQECLCKATEEKFWFVYSPTANTHFHMEFDGNCNWDLVFREHISLKIFTKREQCFLELKIFYFASECDTVRCCRCAIVITTYWNVKKEEEKRKSFSCIFGDSSDFPSFVSGNICLRLTAKLFPCQHSTNKKHSAYTINEFVFLSFRWSTHTVTVVPCDVLCILIIVSVVAVAYSVSSSPSSLADSFILASLAHSLENAVHKRHIVLRVKEVYSISSDVIHSVCHCHCMCVCEMKLSFIPSQRMAIQVVMFYSFDPFTIGWIVYTCSCSSHNTLSATYSSLYGCTVGMCVCLRR